MTDDSVMERVLLSLAASRLIEQRRAHAEEALEQERAELEEKLREQALINHLLNAEDPDEEKFAAEWERNGRKQALEAHDAQQEILKRKRARHGYGF